MHLRACPPLLLTLLAGLPCRAVAQRTGAVPTAPAVTVDTLSQEIRGIPSMPDLVFSATIVRERERKAAPGASVLERRSDVHQRSSDDPTTTRTRERTLVDANSLALVSSTQRMEQPGGALIMSAQRDVIGGRLRSIVTSRGRTDTTWVALPAGTPLLTSYEDVLLRGGGMPPRGLTAQVFVPAPPYHLRVTVDSTGAAATDGLVPVWAHTDSAGTVVSSIQAWLDLSRHAIARVQYRLASGMTTTTTNLSLRAGGARAAAAVVRTRGAPTAEELALAGRYALTGEREMASEIVLRPDGRFAYALAYGALDEEGGGRWWLADGGVVLQSDGTPHDASVLLKDASGMSGDSIVILVADTSGAPVHGIEVDVVQPRTGTSFARTQRGRHVVHYAKGDAPTEISVGYDVVDFMVRFPIAGKPKGTYRFVFDRGDLGRYRFEAARLAMDGDALVLVRNGHRMRYRRR